MYSKSRRWVLQQIDTTATLLDTDGFETLKTFGMDLLHFYPWEARWAENPKGRPKQKLEQMKKKKEKKKRTKKEKMEKMKKMKEKNKKKEKEKKRKPELARLKTQKGWPWQKLERNMRG